MPYIRPEDREKLDPIIWQLADEINKLPGGAPDGALNYTITMLLQKCLLWRSKNYFTLERAIGVLECAKLEMYRRVAAPYEDQKKLESGEVYE